MADFDDDFDDGFDDGFDDDALPDEGGADSATSGGGSNRAFILVGGLLGLVTCLAVLGTLAFLFLRPGGGGQSAYNTQVAEINAQNTQTYATRDAIAAGPPTNTPGPVDTELPSQTPSPTLTATSAPEDDTPTPVLGGGEAGAPEEDGGPTLIPTITQTPSTREPTVTPSRTPTALGGIAFPEDATPTPLPTLSVPIDSTADALTATAIAFFNATAVPAGGGAGDLGATALPDTGLMDDVGLPAVALAGVLLIVVLVVVRALRSMSDQ